MTITVDIPDDQWTRLLSLMSVVYNGRTWTDAELREFRELSTKIVFAVSLVYNVPQET